MMKRTIIQIGKLGLVAMALMINACTKDLDQSNPENASSPSAEEFYSSPEAYLQGLAKLYAGLATTGQSGPAGSPDISNIDEGESQYIRGYYLMQELTTDEAVIGWNDKTIKDFHYQTWTAADLFINATFSRLDFQVKNCNEFLRQTSDEKLDARGVSGTLREDIQMYRQEARFLRALSYWHFLDLFGSVGLVTEDSPTDFFLPEQASKEELFNFIESELTDIMGQMAAPRSIDYPRADRAAAWMVLAKLEMNAERYIGESRYTEAMTYIQNIISSGYALHDSYEELFMADNDTNGAQNEIIFAVAFDGIYTKTYGGTTFLVHAPVGGSMNASEFGINGGWGGIRTTPTFVSKFNLPTQDGRELFHTDGQTLEINTMGDFSNGYAIGKWKNVDSQGNPGSDAAGDFADTDFPMFRMADVYLMYAEVFLRGGGGSASDALNYVNMVRTRAYGDTSGNISSGQLTLDFILDERARELYWECHRRTDLLRFNKFTGGSYIWEWKGNVIGGAPTASFRNLFPIPSLAIAGNPNLTQNPGY